MTFQTTFLTVGDPVERDDGRFYVPVSRTNALDTVPSQVMFRVASDAFESVDDAYAFAKAATEILNFAMEEVADEEDDD